MSTRTPPSIAWLARKYCFAKSELADLEKELAAILTRRDSLQSDVESLARVINIHEVPIEASELALSRKNTSQKKLKYGTLTKTILNYLHNLPSRQDASISEIFYAVIRSADVEVFSELEYLKLRKSVSHQLRNLCRQGRIIRTEKGTGKYTSRYRTLAHGDQLQWDFL
ncbi:hypothetical protein MHM95_18160 [Pseudoalteromonas sp. CnMc7-15]|uniref:hypothetical protein n=1 Tax=unclassified Pseudoalteromonas TaxID=194690 RepID=UPI001EF651CC|nr:hypothetical protein [Pseudoalteromonas sp. CnMc7-15]MCG7568199.1 hypothetical protein [Pseudoalteromonas sp. CnMc7-15]